MTGKDEYFQVKENCVCLTCLREVYGVRMEPSTFKPDSFCEICKSFGRMAIYVTPDPDLFKEGPYGVSEDQETTETDPSESSDKEG